ncbi:MAG: hypothetical protein K8F91_10875 [Candidatus Obscuribacterales bacterium]|nr:hypothetical protein [Candidatus Obscuribacterales bacterium]
MEYQPIIERAAHVIAGADALLIGAGAGMGVDSGMPDFRGAIGFWKAYPLFKGKTFSQVANPRLFLEDPEQAWGFYGHRLNLYRNTVPHRGYEIISAWTRSKIRDYFVFTSNVDGHFQKAKFDEDKIVECHGSINYLQCSTSCGSTGIWSADQTVVEVDELRIRATSKLPTCPECGSIARPNILMFGDFAWNPRRSARQEDRYEKWYLRVKSKNVVAIEFGAGIAIPTVRYECQRRGKMLIRVNPRDYHAPDDAISIPLNALEALVAIDEVMGKQVESCPS